MNEKKDLTLPSQGNMIRDLIMRIRLIWNLMKDNRVSGWIKLIPIAGLVYLVVPFDILPELPLALVGELDDAAVLWLTNYVFLELCPPDVVLQHVKAITGGTPKRDTDDVVDADSVEIKDS